MGRWQAARRRAPGQDPGQIHRPDRTRGASLSLYLDTSALLKLYVEEEGSDLVLGRISEATVSGTSVITYVEARSALARRRQHGELSASEYRRGLELFEADWERFVRAEISDELLRHAAHLAEVHRLRAYDAVHLASAIRLRDRLGGEGTFASWDDNLDRAAARESFQLLRPRKR